MKKYIKSAVVMLLAFIMVFSIVACSKPPMVSQEELEIAEKQGVAEGEVTFTYGPAASSADYRAAADRFVSAFESKYPDVKVETDYTATSDTRIAAADIGDVFYFSEDQTYKYAVSDKALLPLDGFVEKFGIDLSDVYSGIYALGLVNGRLYFVPRDYNHMALIYNKTAVTEAGVSESVKPEWTWEEFQVLCEQLYSEDYYPVELNLGYSPVYTAFFEAYTHRNSWCSTSEKKITFIDEEGKILRAVKEALDLAKKDYAKFPGINDTQEGLQNRDAIFTTCVYPQVQTYGKNFDALDVEWDVINMPLFENPSFGCGASGVGVFSRTQNVTGAAALALFFFTPEGQKAFNAGQGGSVPLLKSIDAEGYDAWKYPDDENWSTKNWDAFVYKADTASTPGQVNCRMPVEVASAIDTDIKKILGQDLAGTTSYLDGFATLEKKCNELWGLLTA
ncbi:MAG: extracellular solute-binding protein [Ruminococcaceae bacterium]|nr:extracellular solute-binding protein [Oscillospiraceae bacterium]